jgi:hypothetical protein
MAEFRTSPELFHSKCGLAQREELHLEEASASECDNHTFGRWGMSINLNLNLS